MARRLLNQLLVAVPTLFVVATLSFLLVRLVPGDPANYILGRNATAEQIAALHTDLGLDRPALTQYLSWLGGALHGDLGTSYVTGLTVGQAVQIAFAPTISLAVLSTLIALVLGLVIGGWIAVRGGRWDTAVQALAGIGLAIPSFWLAALLVLLFALKLAIFPATGYTPINESPWLWFVGLILPATAIGINNFCQVVMQTRASVLDVLSRDFVRTLQATGLPRRRIIYRHVLRNAAIPVVTVTGLAFIFTLSGVVVIEAIFNTPGMGNLLLTSVQSHDLPVVQGVVLLFAVLVIGVNFVSDLVAAWLDPRIRLS
ncbi:ABC transporter permease [Actinoplanes sp. NPDC051851]|uniref:ABC transporter permease n=1 Tax=Actinoplanes sp. NPDC051851 TaxID=3154753 RepID=UPI003412C900